MHIIYDDKLDKFIEFRTDQEFELICYYVYKYYDEDFDSQEFIDSFQEKGVIQPWKANFVEINNGQIQKNREWNENHKHYVGTPKMTSLCRYLGQNLNVELNTKINKLVKLKTRKLLLARLN